MKKLFLILTSCVAVTALSVSAFAQSDSQSDQQKSKWQGSSSSSSSSMSSESGSDLSSTGRESTQLIPASRINGAQVSDSSGQQIGRIEEVIFSPSSGRIDFALISLSGSGASGSSPGSSSQSGGSSSTSPSSDTPGSRNSPQSSGSSSSMGADSSSTTYGSTSTTSGSSRGKLVAVPWSLLQPSGAGFSASASSSSSGSIQASSSGQLAFRLNADRSKLESAPSVTRGSWSELSQSGWRQRVYSYYGVSDTSTGGAESPSGVSQGSGAKRLKNLNSSQESNPVEQNQTPEQQPR